MFEAAILPAVAGPSARGDAPGALRPLDWGEIVSRLSAARDLRAVLARPVGDTGSFAAQVRSGLTRSPEAERDVNHDALGRGKMPAAISVATAEEAAVGDQGMR